MNNNVADGVSAELGTGMRRDLPFHRVCPLNSSIPQVLPVPVMLTAVKVYNSCVGV